MHTNERREVTITHFLQLFPRATVRAIFAEFLRILQISPTSRASNDATPFFYFIILIIFLAGVFVDEDSDSDVAVAESLSNLSE